MSKVFISGSAGFGNNKSITHLPDVVELILSKIIDNEDTVLIGDCQGIDTLVHLYGHVHTGRDSRPFEEYVKQMQQREAPYKCYNVGAMLPYMNYTPRTLMEIRIANGYKPAERGENNE